MNTTLSLARRVLMDESDALSRLAATLDTNFVEAVSMLSRCRGSVIVCGVGKAGHIGQKIAASLASLGTPSHFLHPAEAIHGDFGRVTKNDIVLMLSHSGESEEVTRLLPMIRSLGVPLVAITAKMQSTLGRTATLTLTLGELREADPHGLAPTTTTTAMLALGDAIALATSQQRGFRREDFARCHPGGALGRQLAKVEEQMRPLKACRTAPDYETVREVFVRHSIPGRRSGAVLILDETGRLAGLFTDSDLARLFESRNEIFLDEPIRCLMTTTPTTVNVGSRTIDAVSLMAARKFSELPVVDDDGFPHGLLDITDLVAFIPRHEEKAVEFLRVVA
ncbi:MAG: KpsF/GutQ family sugar-phosphate isomerase [Thermoguttaceae bacterium]